MPSALITGLQGFTGRYLANELYALGFDDVFGTARSLKTLDKNIISVDLCDKKAVESVVSRIKPDVVAHLAAISFVGHYDFTEMYQTNIIGTRNLLEALANLEKTPSSILLASSANVYGNRSSQPIDESNAVSPSNDYAISKCAMEQVSTLWADKLPITIVRPFNYTGVGQSKKFLLPKIVDHYQRACKSIELGNLKISRDFSDVRDVVKFYAKLLNQNSSGGVYNVCSGKAYTLAQVLKMITEFSGYQIEVKVNPAFVRKNEVDVLTGSDTKLVQKVGQIERHPLNATLRWMFEANT